VSSALSRQSIKAGPAINFGEDPHDLRLRRVGGTRTYAIGVVQPGEVADLETKLAAGKFVLWCSIADHRPRGMHAVLTVRPQAPLAGAALRTRGSAARPSEMTRRHARRDTDRSRRRLPAPPSGRAALPRVRPK